MTTDLNPGEVVGKIYDLLKDLEPPERNRVLRSTKDLFDETAELYAENSDATPLRVSERGTTPPAVGHQLSAQEYFDHKDPRNKGEELAVAAMYLEEAEEREVCNQDDLKRIIREARRNFDSAHFARDIANATCQAGFFNKGTSKNEYRLSYFGQQYVCKLPDREAAKQGRRPVRKSKSARKASMKRSTKKGAQKQ